MMFRNAFLTAAAALGLGFSSSGAAQATPPVTQPPAAADSTAPALATILGTVYDSVHNAHLAGATVFVVGSTRIGLTNDRGAFLVDSVPEGTYRVHVQHDFLDSLGLSMVTDTMTIAAGERRVLEMAIPSAETLVSLSCTPATRRIGPSAIIGRLLDADTDQPVVGARVSFAWSELSLAAGLRQIPKVLGSTAGNDGVFRICGVPAEVEGTLQAEKAGITTAEIKVTFIGQPLVIQGLKIGNENTVTRAEPDSTRRVLSQQNVGEQRFSATNLQRGEAVLRGKVVSANGSPVAGARVEVEGTVTTPVLTNAAGEFVLAELPSGTQSVVARQMGFAPVTQPVELSTRGPQETIITMSRPVQMLETVVVEAQSELQRGLEQIGFTQRQRGLSGTFMDADDIMKRGPNILSDVFRTVPTLRVVPDGPYDYKVESSRGHTLGGNCVKYWLDGNQFQAIFPGDVDRMIPPYQIAAIEVYNGSSVPIQFSSANTNNCAVIVIWSKYRAGQPGNRRR
jgi:hypothetical protein